MIIGISVLFLGKPKTLAGRKPVITLARQGVSA
jgi:hypothetical protein